MTHAAYKRIAFTLGSICIVLLALVGWLAVSHVLLRLRIAFADGQIQVFHEMRVKATQSNAKEAAGYLRYVVEYYSSGTKQVAGSQLDHLVERERECAVSEIVTHLRTKTGENLGDDPAAWIQKYAAK